MRMLTLLTNDTLLDISKLLIINAEGFRSSPYADSLGNMSIGYGFNLDAPEFSKLSVKITVSEANVILEKKIKSIMADVHISTTSILERAVLIDMIYNMGKAGFEQFIIFLDFLKMNDINSAVCDLTNTLYYKQVNNRAVRNCFNLLNTDNKRIYLI